MTQKKGEISRVVQIRREEKVVEVEMIGQARPAHRRDPC